MSGGAIVLLHLDLVDTLEELRGGALWYGMTWLATEWDGRGFLSSFFFFSFVDGFSSMYQFVKSFGESFVKKVDVVAKRECQLLGAS